MGVDASLHCTKLSAEFEFGSHSLGAYPKNVAFGYTTLGKSVWAV